MVTFNERLKLERKRLGISQDELAEVADVTRKSVVNYESGLRVPDATFLTKIAQAGADVTFILTGIRTQPSAQDPASPQESPPDECIEDVLKSMVYLENWLARQRGKMDPDIKAYAIRLIHEAWRKREQKGETSPDKNLEKVLLKLMI
ncbi:MAG: helix-turn-helix transcriptional regulator [Magnetococcales bacterium]|nr:helix-turn-helix transcriptional regulator [Magnetococcales bacterium]